MTANDLIDAALSRAEGDREHALRILALQAIRWRKGVSVGFTREGGPLHPDWSPQPIPEPVLTHGGQ